MKRFYALWRSRFSLGRFVVALSLPLAAASAMAGEWGGSPPDDVAYTVCSNVQTADASDDKPHSETPADEPLCGDGQCGCGCDDYGCGECDCGGCGCDSYSSCWCADNLLCDNWAGRLACCGIGADMELTQFYQGVASGGREQNSEYGGKLDYFFNFDGQKMGLWEGLSAVMHAETRFGDSVIFDAVGLAPVNANMLYPSPLENETAITGFLINQQLNEAVAGLRRQVQRVRPVRAALSANRPRHRRLHECVGLPAAHLRPHD